MSLRSALWAHTGSHCPGRLCRDWGLGARAFSRPALLQDRHPQINLGELVSVISSHGHCLHHPCPPHTRTHTRLVSTQHVCELQPGPRTAKVCVFEAKRLGAPAKKNQLKLRKGGASEIMIQISEKMASIYTNSLGILLWS